MNTERRIQELEHTKDTLHELGTSVHDEMPKMKDYEKHVCYLEKKVSEPSKHLLSKDAMVTGY